MADPTDDDDALLRRLYDEPDADDASGEVERLRRMRGAFREYARATDEEPPSRGLDELMAAARARVASRPAVEPVRVSLWARLRRWFTVVLAHPALASAAVVMLIAGVAGVLYVRGKIKVDSVPAVRTEQTAGSSRTEAVPAPPAGTEDTGMTVGLDEAEQPAVPDPASKEAVTRPATQPKPPPRKRVEKSKGKAPEPPPPPPSSAGAGGAAQGGENRQTPDDDVMEAGPSQATTLTPPEATVSPPPPAAPAPGREVTGSAKPDVALLTKEARTAAKAGNCPLVNNLGVRVRAADASYYARNFAPDTEIKKCAETGSRSPPRATKARK